MTPYKPSIDVSYAAKDSTCFANSFYVFLTQRHPKYSSSSPPFSASLASLISKPSGGALAVLVILALILWDVLLIAIKAWPDRSLVVETL